MINNAHDANSQETMAAFEKLVSAFETSNVQFLNELRSRSTIVGEYDLKLNEIPGISDEDAKKIVNFLLLPSHRNPFESEVGAFTFNRRIQSFAIMLS